MPKETNVSSSMTVEEMLRAVKAEPKPIEADDLQAMHRQLVSMLKLVNRSMGREIRVTVVR